MTDNKSEAYGRHYLEGFRQRATDLRRELDIAENRLAVAESQFAAGRMVTGFPTGESPIERVLSGKAGKAAECGPASRECSSRKRVMADPQTAEACWNISGRHCPPKAACHYPLHCVLDAGEHTGAKNTEQAIDVLIDALRDGTMKPNRTWAIAMSALLRRREQPNA